MLINMSSKGEEANYGGAVYAPLDLVAIAPSLSHSIYTLIGFAWPAFGLVFLIMFCSSDWLALTFPVQWLFPLVCLLSLLLGHGTAMALESRAVTGWLYFFRRGMPLVFYRRFATLQEMATGAQAGGGDWARTSDGADASSDLAGGGAANIGAKALERGRPAIIFGAKRILLSAVDELHLTFLGMLEIRSYAASGKVFTAVATANDTPLNKADLVARIPIGALALSDQKRFVEIFRGGRPGLTVNKRLDDRLNSPIVKGQALISSIGAVILLYALFDVGYATFTWLEMLKDYYGSQLCLRHPDKAQLFLGASGQKQEKAVAQDLYDRAERLRTHPFALSWGVPGPFYQRQ
jgi:hypothetical protein